MPLNEHEQKILDEIERKLYEDDPKLAELVAKAVRNGRDRWKMRLAAVLFVAGAVVMFASFTRSWAIAGAGFLLMVASAGWMALTARANRTSTTGATDVIERLQRRWRREG
jgi:peptidoglycan/LPS O-acetylase OafA/YrhL